MGNQKEMMLRNMTAIYIEQSDKFLMLYRIGSKVVAPAWCGIGGHFEMEELNRPQHCVLRELFEEAKIEEAMLYDLRLRYVTLRLKAGEIRQNYYYFAKLKSDADVPVCSDEGFFRWVPVEQLRTLEMPLTAKQMLTHYLEIGRFTEELYCGVTGQDEMYFAPLKEF